MNEVEGGSSQSEFLSEVRAQFERELDLRKTLDSTSASLTTTSMAIVGALIAVGTFLISKIEPKENIFYWSLIILGIGVGLATISIIYFMISRTQMRAYRVPISPHASFKDNEYKDGLAEQYMNARKDEFIRIMIREYLVCISSHENIDNVRSRMIRGGLWFLYPAILSIAILVILILTAYGLNIITLKF